VLRAGQNASKHLGRLLDGVLRGLEKTLAVAPKSKLATGSKGK